MTPEFSISILAYQNLALTRKCIESVLAGGGKFELILTDNGCKDGTAEYFDSLAKANPKGVTVLHNPENLGFIEPNRRAFKIARGRFFVLLNNDTLVPNGWLDMLRLPFASDPNCAMSGPIGGCSQLRADFHGENGPRFEYLEGAMLCMDRERIKGIELSLFPQELEGAYGEDAYLSLRVRESGFNIHRVALQFTHYRCATSAMVPQCREWQAANHRFLQQRFKRYMIGHTFAYPTIVKRNAAWGDVLLTTAIIRALKKLRPMSPIWVETICEAVFNGNPDVAHVSRSPMPQPEAHILVNLNGISEMKPSMPIIQAYAECAGVELDDETTSMYPMGGDIEWAKRAIPEPGWIAVHMGPTTWRCKNWPFDRWTKLLWDLHEEGHKIVLVGNDNVPQMTTDLDLRGKTNVAQLAALLGEVDLFIGLDSFPIHVAQAMKTPVVGLFGITTAAKILTRGSPWLAVESPADHPGTGLRHKLVGKSNVDCPQNPMDEITVDQVIAGVRTALKTIKRKEVAA